jgi:hypothetical protein
MKRICFLVCVLISIASDLFGTDLRDVIAHPQKYENRRITVVGIARVPGYFYLCADKEAATDRHPEKALLVRKTGTQPEYREMDRQWVEITGIMNDKEGGGYELGPTRTTNPGILLQRVRLLRDRPPPRIKDDTVCGIFKNSTPEPLSIEVIPKSEGGVIFFLRPGDVDETEIWKGRAVASQLKGPKNVPLHKREIGNPVASGEITFRGLASNFEYSDEPSEKRRLYFKIADHQIKRVDGSEGRAWKRQ